MASFSTDVRVAALELIDYTCDGMHGQHATFDRVLDFLRTLKEAMAQHFFIRVEWWFDLERLTTAGRAHDIVNLAIIIIENRSGKYRRNLRRFYEVALVEMYGVIVVDPTAYDDEVHDSLGDLNKLVGDAQSPAHRDWTEVISDLKRDWRMLGREEARRWEPLYEAVTGKELRNE
ncbi:MAG: hypothetical protein Q9182_005126 [Xanthomendoza sp. 2 TL-2023]